MTRPLRADIDLVALRHNFEHARRVAPNSRVMSVIKADGYGHGHLALSRTLNGSHGFAVSCMEEAIPLRDSGIDRPVLLLEGCFSDKELVDVSQYDFTIVVHNEEQLNWLGRMRPSSPIDIWLKFDTGMNRLGLPVSGAAAVIERVSQMRRVKLKACMTHLSCADDREAEITTKQITRFSDIVGNWTGPVSIANSAAILSRADSHGDWIRPGIMLYGASPFAGTTGPEFGLLPVMTFSSELISIRACKAGDTVGYGAEWHCPEDMYVGVVAVGYGDGYPRHAPPGTPVLVNGRQSSLIGRVSMDMITVDLRACPEAKTGDPVVLWGQGLPVEKVATAAGTISYELLCGVTARVPRHYLEQSTGQG